MSKRSLSIFAIILLLLFSSLQFVSCGEDSSLKFTLSTDKSGYFVSSIGSFDGSDLVIPSEYRGKPVIGISIEAFYGATNLKSVVIPDSVTRINDYSFAGCTELTSLTLPQNLNYIGNHAFEDCTKLLEHENGVYYIGDWAVWADSTSESSLDPTTVFLREGTVGVNLAAAKSGYGSAPYYQVYLPQSIKNLSNFFSNGSIPLFNRELYYAGTTEEWSQVQLPFLVMGKYTVHCSDGDLSIGN